MLFDSHTAEPVSDKMIGDEMGANIEGGHDTLRLSLMRSQSVLSRSVSVEWACYECKGKGRVKAAITEGSHDVA